MHFFSLKWDCYGLSFSLGCNHNFAMLHSCGDPVLGIAVGWACSSVPGRLPAELEQCHDVPRTVGRQVGARTSHVPQAQCVLQWAPPPALAAGGTARSWVLCPARAALGLQVLPPPACRRAVLYHSMICNLFPDSTITLKWRFSNELFK